MKPADRAKLTTALRDHVAKVADDLRAQMQSNGLRTEGGDARHGHPGRDRGGCGGGTGNPK